MTKRDVQIALGVFAFTLLMFVRLIFCEFTWWDDPQTIHHNPLLNPPTWSSLGHYWTAMGPASPMGLYAPVTYTLWWLLAWVAHTPATVDNIRLSPAVFHGTNVLLHATSAAVVFVVLGQLLNAKGKRRTSNAKPSHLDSLAGPEEHVFPALAGALLFAIHPVQVETVAWASGTKDLLCGLFTLVAIERYIRFTRATGRHRTNSYVAIFVAVLLGMLSKPTAVIAPLLLLAVGYVAFDRRSRQLLPELWPTLALIVPCGIVARWSQPATFSSPVPLLGRPLVAVDAITFYLGKLIWPLHLSPDYGRSPGSLLQAGRLFTGGSFSLLLVVIVSIMAWRKRWLMLAALLFLIPLLPVLGLQPFLYQYHSTVTDHYLYLPMLGVALLLTIACGRLPKVVVVLMLVLLAGRTLTREPAWQNTRTLFAAAVADDPTTFGNFDMLGFTYALEASRAARSGNSAEAQHARQLAVDNYTRAIALNPLDVPARDNLARVELNRGNRAAALEQTRQIIALQPQLPADLRADPVDLQRRLHEFAGD